MQIQENGRMLNLGIIGCGNRSEDHVRLLENMEDVRILAVCDKYEDRAQKMSERTGAPGFTDYHDVLKIPEIEAVIIITDWLTHIPIAVDALKAGKHVGLEVGGAPSIDDCWRLVHTAEETGMTCMLLENCCYGKEEMALLNMVRQGVFGDVVQCQGAYAHDLRGEIGLGDVNRHYRQDNFLHRNAELYPTHELGPIAQYLRLGRGNRMVSLVSMSTAAKGLHQWFQVNRADSPLKDAQVNQGDIVTTMIKCANGETIILSHDCTLPRPYSRGGVIRGTKGLWMEDNRSVYLEESAEYHGEFEHKWVSDAEVMKKYCHPLWIAFEEFGQRGGHGGMDYLVLRAFIECIQTGTPAPLDVYDTAMLMSITALSEKSIALGSAPVAVPDFTNGNWVFDHGDKGETIYKL